MAKKPPPKMPMKDHMMPDGMPMKGAMPKSMPPWLTKGKPATKKK